MLGQLCGGIVDTQLTVQEVEQLLTRAGLDCTALTLTEIDRSATHTAGMYAELYVHHRVVVIRGDETCRRLASTRLHEEELWCAPFSDRDEWSRDSQPEPLDP